MNPEVSAYAKNDARYVIRTHARRVLALATEATKMNEPQKAQEYAYTYAWMEKAAESIDDGLITHMSPEMREVTDPEPTKYEPFQVDETIEEDRSADPIVLERTESEDIGYTELRISSGNNAAIVLQPDKGDQSVGINTYTTVTIDGKRYEVAQYLNVDNYDDAKQISDDLLSAFPESR
jgi:hypothetical protein